MGQGEPLVFLHGWQSSMDAFLVVAEELKYQYKIILIDFPPFGKSGELSCAWSVNDYSDMVFELLKTLQINNFCILAHSFGGRVAINLCTCYNCIVKKLVLCGSAGLKPRRSLTYYYKIFKYKQHKRKAKSENQTLENFGSDAFTTYAPNACQSCKFSSRQIGKKNILSNSFDFWTKRQGNTTLYGKTLQTFDKKLQSCYIFGVRTFLFFKSTRTFF